VSGICFKCSNPLRVINTCVGMITVKLSLCRAHHCLVLMQVEHETLLRGQCDLYSLFLMATIFLYYRLVTALFASLVKHWSELFNLLKTLVTGEPELSMEIQIGL